MERNQYKYSYKANVCEPTLMTANSCRIKVKDKYRFIN